MTGSTLAALCGVGMLTYAVQSSAQAQLAAAPESSRPVLPENPNLTTPVPPAPDAVAVPDTTSSRPTRVRVGLNGGVATRPAKTDVVSYQPGFTWGGYVGIAILPWIGLRASSQVTSHGVDAHDGAWGLSNPGFDPPHLRELALAGAVELRKLVAPRVAVWGGGGIAWTRLSMSMFLLEEPWPVAVETRSGVTLEVPVHVGASYILGRPADVLDLALTVEFRYSPVLSTSGQLFFPDAGESESVRSDTGARVEIGGVPGVEAARVVLLGLEAAF